MKPKYRSNESIIKNANVQLLKIKGQIEESNEALEEAISNEYSKIETLKEQYNKIDREIAKARTRITDKADEIDENELLLESIGNITE